MDQKPPPIENILGRRIGIAGRAMRNRLSGLLTQAGVNTTLEQLIVMINLWHHDGMYQQEIADVTSCDKAKTTRLIDSLESRKLVYREIGRQDRRRKLIHLTDKGRNLCSTGYPFVEQTQSEAIKDIDPDHVRICREVLRQIAENLSG